MSEQSDYRKCAICGGWGWFGNPIMPTHRCGTRFEFAPEHDPDNWRPVYYNIMGANPSDWEIGQIVEKAAEKLWDTETGDTMRLWLRQADSNIATLYTVDIEPVPSFSLRGEYAKSKRETRTVELEAEAEW